MQDGRVQTVSQDYKTVHRKAPEGACYGTRGVKGIPSCQGQCIEGHGIHDPPFCSYHQGTYCGTGRRDLFGSGSTERGTGVLSCERRNRKALPDEGEVTVLCSCLGNTQAVRGLPCC